MLTGDAASHPPRTRHRVSLFLFGLVSFVLLLKSPIGKCPTDTAHLEYGSGSKIVAQGKQGKLSLDDVTDPCASVTSRFTPAAGLPQCISWEGNYLQRKAATRLPGCGLTCMEFRHHLSCPHKRKAEQRESSNSSMQQRTEVMGQTVPQKTEETGAYRASQVPGTWAATPTPQQ